MLRKDPFITGEFYHIYNRGIDKRIIFKLKRDYERFMILLYIANSCKSFRLDDLLNKSKKTFTEVMFLDKGEPIVSLGLWCLMPNHFHLLVKQEVDGGISKFMKKLGTGYSMFFNVKYQRKGALFGGPFKSNLIGSDDNYMLQLFAYIHLNPLDIKFSGWENKIQDYVSDEMKFFLENYPYSSYFDYTSISGGRAEKNIINSNNFPNYFKNLKSFKDFINGYLTTIS